MSEFGLYSQKLGGLPAISEVIVMVRQEQSLDLCSHKETFCIILPQYETIYKSTVLQTCTDHLEALNKLLRMEPRYKFLKKKSVKIMFRQNSKVSLGIFYDFFPFICFFFFSPCSCISQMKRVLSYLGVIRGLDPSGSKLPTAFHSCECFSYWNYSSFRTFSN